MSMRAVDSRAWSEVRSRALVVAYSHKKLMVSRYRYRLGMTALQPLEARFRKREAGASNNDAPVFASDAPTCSTGPVWSTKPSAYSQPPCYHPEQRLLVNRISSPRLGHFR